MLNPQILNRTYMYQEGRGTELASSPGSPPHWCNYCELILAGGSKVTTCKASKQREQLGTRLKQNACYIHLLPPPQQIEVYCSNVGQWWYVCLELELEILSMRLHKISIFWGREEIEAGGDSRTNSLFMEPWHTYQVSSRERGLRPITPLENGRGGYSLVMWHLEQC